MEENIITWGGGHGNHLLMDDLLKRKPKAQGGTEAGARSPSQGCSQARALAHLEPVFGFCGKHM